MYLFFFIFSFDCDWRDICNFFQVPAGAMEESSKEDGDSNVQDEIIKNKIFMTFFVKFGVITPSELKAYASA